MKEPLYLMMKDRGDAARQQKMTTWGYLMSRRELHVVLDVQALVQLRTGSEPMPFPNLNSSLRCSHQFCHACHRQQQQGRLKNGCPPKPTTMTVAVEHLKNFELDCGAEVGVWGRWGAHEANELKL
jgi:hypothetical protein